MSFGAVVKDKVFFFATAGVASFPLWPKKVTVFLILYWFMAAIYEHVKFKEFSSRRNLKWALLFSSIYLLYLTVFLWSSPSKEAFHIIERKFALLVFPVGFYLCRRKFSNLQFSQLLKVFQLSNLLLGIYLYIRLIPMFIEHHHLLTLEGFNYAFRLAVENISGIHPTYLSILFLFSLYLQLKWLFNGQFQDWKSEKWASYLHLVLLSLLCVLMAARGPILSFLLTIIVTLFLRNWKKAAVVTVVSATFLLIVISFFPASGNRFMEIVDAKEVSESQSTVNSTNIRMSIHYCSTELIRSNWLTGVGLTELQEELNRCYGRYENEVFSGSNYNTHNQYFDVLLSVGIVGLLLFIVILTFPIYHSIVNRNENYFFFVFFIALCFSTENLLSRQYGVVFFAFFMSFFAHVFINKEVE